MTSEATPSSGLVLRRGDETEMYVAGQAIVDLGVLPLPPGGYSTAWAVELLKLVWRGSGTLTAEVDCFALFPAVSFRRLQTISGLGIPNNASITDDPTEGRVYCTFPSGEGPWAVARNSPVLVWPNTLQRLYFLWSLSDHSAPIAQTFTVKAWYRPRKLAF